VAVVRHLWSSLVAFRRSSASERRGDILLGKSWTGEGGTTWFRLFDLRLFLAQNSIDQVGLTDPAVYGFFHRRGLVKRGARVREILKPPSVVIHSLRCPMPTRLEEAGARHLGP
jgi:hypothetical protein